MVKLSSGTMAIMCEVKNIFYLLFLFIYLFCFLNSDLEKNVYFFLVIPRVVVPPTPALPSAPPADEGYDSGGNGGRGTIRPHSVSPFTRNVRPKGEENEDEEMVDFDAAIACLVNLSTRREVTTMNSFGEENVTVRTFSTPTTPAATPRPEHPPRIVSRRILPIDTPRPRPLHRASAALGAPPGTRIVARRKNVRTYRNPRPPPPTAMRPSTG